MRRVSRQMMVPESQFDRLREKGLLLSAPYGSDHAGFPNGVRIAKPESVHGNGVPGHEVHWGIERDAVVVDAPVLTFHGDDGQRIVECHQWVPGPGPGDFRLDFVDPGERPTPSSTTTSPSRHGCSSTTPASRMRRVASTRIDRLIGSVRVARRTRP